MKLTGETFGTFDDFIKWVHGFEELEKENKQIQRDYSHLLKQKKDCEDRSYSFEQKLEKIKHLAEIRYDTEIFEILDGDSTS